MTCSKATLTTREELTSFNIVLVPFTTWLLRQERTSFTIYCRALQREFVPYTFEGDIPETFYDDSVEKEYGFIDIVRK